MIKQTGFGVIITTKSATILEDLEILKQINQNQSVLINITITCADDKLAQLIEPHVSLSSKRFEALKILRQNNLYAGVLMMPILPLNKIYAYVYFCPNG